MYGSAGRLGLLIPANNTVIEPEFHRFLPSKIAAYATRLLGSASTIDPEAIDRMQAQALRGAREVAMAQVQAIAYACMGTTLVQPPSWADELTADIEDEVGIPAVTASQATVKALEHIGATSIGVVTPYPDRLAKLLPDFFHRHGLNQHTSRHLGVADVREVGHIARDVIITAAGEVAQRPGIDAVCMLATDWVALSCLHTIRVSSPVPVITTNQAMLWWLTQHLGSNIELSAIGEG